MNYLKQEIKILFDELARNPWAYGNTIADIENKINYQQPYILTETEKRVTFAVILGNTILWCSRNKKNHAILLAGYDPANLPDKPRKRRQMCQCLLNLNRPNKSLHGTQPARDVLA